MSYTASATCSECGSSHSTTQATQARADSIANQLARTCAGNDRQKKVYEEARRRKEQEQANRRKGRR